MIDVRNIYFKSILKDIQFTLNTGETLGIIGPNGSGKTTLINIIAGELSPSRGQLFIDNQLIGQGRFPFEKVALVPQQYTGNSLFPLSFSQLLLMPYKIKESAKLLPPWDQNFYQELLDRLHITSFLDKNITILSVGERQRCLLAMALLKRPKILILDEPLSGLDGAGVDQILEVLQWAPIKNTMAIIVIDHQIGHLIKNADKILCLNKTGHWHDYKNQLTKEILQNYYHCEFEHLLLHSQGLEGKECKNHGTH